MSGPVSPPLATTESGTATIVRPTNTLEFNGADFTVTGSGSKATISIDSTGAGAALTATEIGFGDGSNLLTGDSVFTYTTPGSLPTVTLGDSTLQDAGGNFKLTGKDNLQIQTNSTFGSIKMYPATGSNNAFEIAYTGAITMNQAGSANGDVTMEGGSNANLFKLDAGQDNIGIAVQPPSGHAGQTVRLTVQGDNDAIALMLQNDGTDADDGPEMVFYRNSASPAADDLLGRIRFDGEDSGDNIHTYFRMTNAIKDPTDASEDGRFLFESRSGGSLIEVMRFEGDDIDINANNVATVDVKIRGDNDTILFSDASQDNLGLGTSTPGSDVERLHVKGTGADVLVRLESTEGGATAAPDLELFRNSASPASGDFSGQIQFTGYEDTAGSSKVTYGEIDVRMFGLDGTESGNMVLKTRQNNANRPQISMNQVGVTINENHEASFDFVVESDESSAGFHNLYADSGQNNIGMGCVPDSGVERLHVKGTGTGDLVMFESTDTGASAAPDFVLYRGVTGANADYLGNIKFRGQNDASEDIEYAVISSNINRADDGDEEGWLILGVMTNGTFQQNYLTLRGDASQVVVNETGAADIDFRVEGDTNANLIRTDAGQDNVGIGGTPDSDVERLHVKGTGSADPMVRIESTDADAAVGPLLEMFRNSASPADNDKIGTIHFTADDDGGTKRKFAQIEAILRDDGAGAGQYDGAVIFRAARFDTEDVEFLRYGLDAGQNHSEVVVNENGLGYVDFRCESDNNAEMFVVEASDNLVGVGARPSSTGAQLQVALGAQFYRETSNTFTANHDITVDQAHGHVLVMDASGSGANTFTLPDVAAIGMHVKLVNLAGSNGMTVAVAGSTSHQINGAGTAGSSSVSTTTKFQTIECHYVATNVWVATEPAVAA